MSNFIYDIETMNCGFLCSLKNIKTGEFEDFTINDYENQLTELLNRLKEKDIEYFIGFNNVNFDAQVIEFIIRNGYKWIDVPNRVVYKKIAKFAQEVIHSTNYNVFPPFNEENLSIKQIDLFLIMHYNNENRRTGLKWLQYMMDWENVEEMPYSHLLETISPKEWKEIVDYCHNDVNSTHRFYDYVTGNVDNPTYKGKNKIQDRVDLIKNQILPEKAMNYSDSKIGDEMNKLNYCKITGVNPKDLHGMKKGRGATKKFTFGDAIPEYVKFQTKEFIDFYNSIKDKKVPLSNSDKTEFKFTYNKTTYSIARGGIHSNEKNRIIIPKSNEILRDADVGLKNVAQIKLFKLTGISLELCALSLAAMTKAQ